MHAFRTLYFCQRLTLKRGLPAIAGLLVFSERELMFMCAICRRPSVCRLSATFVHPTQAIEIFGNVSTPFGTLAICDPSVKILRRSSQGNPSVGWLNQRRVEKCSDFGPFKAISRKRCKVGGKLLLITKCRPHNVVFSERELMFTFATCRRPSVCLSSVCLSSVVCL